MKRRLIGVLTTELALAWRHRVVPAAAVVTAIWVGVLVTLPEDARRGLLPFVLFMDLTALGFFFIPAMTLVERSEGVLEALSTTRLAPWEHALIRLFVMTGISVAASSAAIAVCNPPSSRIVLAGVTLASLLSGMLAMALVRGVRSFTEFMVRVPFVAVPLLLPAIVRLVGLSQARWLDVSPMTSVVAMLGGHASLAGLVWIFAWLLGLTMFLMRPAPSELHASAGERRSRWPRGGAVRSLMRADRLSLMRDTLTLMLLAGVPLVALVARLFSIYGVDWLETIYPIDFAANLPFVWALLLVVHTPIMFGSIAGLLFLEEQDSGLLPAIAVTRASLRTLLLYRLGAAAAASVVMTLLGFVIAGATHRASVTGLILTAMAAGPLAPVTAMLMTSFASNRAQGVAAMKTITLPLYLPLGLWFVKGPARHLLDFIPTTWAVRAMWSGSGPEAAVAAAVGCVVSSALVLALARGFERRRVA